MADCTKYKFKLWHLIMPQPYIFITQCETRDKTNLLVVSLIRTILYSLIFWYLNSIQYIQFDYQLGITPILLYCILLSIIIINVAYLILVYLKIPEYDTVTIDEEMARIAQELIAQPEEQPPVFQYGDPISGDYY